MQPYTEGHADKPEVTSSVESLEGSVLGSCNWSSQWISVDNDGDWACFHCSPALCYMGMRTAGNLPFVDLLYFVLSRQCWCLRVHNTGTHTHTHTNTHIYIMCKRAPPLQSLQSVHKGNGRRWQIRRGTWVHLQRERKHIGRTFNLPQPSQIEHPGGNDITRLAVAISHCKIQNSLLSQILLSPAWQRSCFLIL